MRRKTEGNLDRWPPRSASHVVLYVAIYTHDELCHNDFWLLAVHQKGQLRRIEQFIEQLLPRLMLLFRRSNDP